MRGRKVSCSSSDQVFDRLHVADHSSHLGVFGASVLSMISILDPSAAVKLLCLKSFTYEQHTPQMGPVVPPTVERSVIPTAKSTLDLAAPAMAIVGIRPLTVELAASLAARRPLPQRTQLPLDLMAVAALPSLVPPATPMVPLEAAAPLMVIAAKQPITAAPDVRVDAMAGPVQHQTRLRRKQQHRRRLLKSPSSAYQQLGPSMAQPQPMEPVAPRTVVLFAVTGHKEAVALPTAYVSYTVVLNAC